MDPRNPCVGFAGYNFESPNDVVARCALFYGTNGFRFSYENGAVALPAFIDTIGISAGLLRTIATHFMIDSQSPIVLIR